MSVPPPGPAAPLNSTGRVGFHSAARAPALRPRAAAAASTPIATRACVLFRILKTSLCAARRRSRFHRRRSTAFFGRPYTAGILNSKAGERNPRQRGRLSTDAHIAFKISPAGGRKGMLHDEVVARLKHMLVEGEIRPGERVPERALCLAFGISRTPLREALKVLAAEGYVTLLPNRGARAAKLTREDVRELFEVCEGLEAVAGELACRRITEAEVRGIAADQAEMVEHHRTNDLVQYYRCNRRIHEAIVRAARNA